MNATPRRSTIAAQHVDIMARVESAACSTLVPRGTLITVQIGRRTDNRAEIIDFNRRMNAR